jgi:hypothetical protein
MKVGGSVQVTLALLIFASALLLFIHRIILVAAMAQKEKIKNSQL